MQRFDQRQGFLVSATIHLTLLMLLIAYRPAPRTPDEIDLNTLERKDIVFLPPAAVLRQLVPTPPPAARPQAVPVPTPPLAQAPPPVPQKKDRISVGPPSDLRMKGPMILRREDDLTKVPKGQMNPPAPAAPQPVAPTPAPPAEVARKGGGVPEVPGREGLRLPPGLLGGTVPRGEEGQRVRPGTLGPQIAGAVEGLSRRLERDSQLGLPTGTGQNLGGLYFDPQGADFTLWVNTFKNEVYRNWIVPQAALFGFRGHVDFEFTVERNGSMSALRLLKSSGTTSLDRAAQNALTGSRFLPLPDDYGPPRVTIQVTFFYNEAPQGS
ncbi:MAG TPA: TonB family protein [Vicinamibacteria bacterium]|nr:TonB family protein [Vicinamibacteria bacterium]